MVSVLPASQSNMSFSFLSHSTISPSVSIREYSFSWKRLDVGSQVPSQEIVIRGMLISYVSSVVGLLLGKIEKVLSIDKQMCIPVFLSIIA